MLPVIPVVWLLVWLLNRNSNGRPMSPVARVVLLKGLGLGLAAILLAQLWAIERPQPVAAVVLLGVGMSAFALPSVFIRGVAIPLGWARVTHALTRLLHPLAFSADRRGGAVLLGALALARRQRSPRTLATLGWLEEQLMREKALGGAGLVAAGLLMAMRGDVAQARSLLWWAHRLPAQGLMPRARAEARQWLIADAVRRDCWDEAATLGLRYGPVPGWSHAVGQMAARLEGLVPAPADWRLWLAWLSTPHWRATWPLLQRALAAPRASRPTPTQSVPGACAPADLPQALGRLAEALRRGTHDEPALAQAIAAAGAWFGSAATRAHLEQRLAPKGIGSAALRLQPAADTVLAACRERLVELVVPLLERSPQLAARLGEATTDDGGGAVVADAVRRVRDRLFADVEAQCADYRERTAAQHSLEALVEHRAWVRLRDAADRLLALDPHGEYTLFQAMFLAVCNFAVYQHNECKRPLLAYEMFSWLHGHAQGHPEALALLARNVAVLTG